MSTRFENTITALVFLLSFFAIILFMVIFPKVSFARHPSPTPSPYIVSVKNFGAKGDGITDDAPAIQKTINSVSSGATVYIPAGTYMLGTSAGGVENFPNGTPIQSALILNKNSITLSGDGSSSILKLMAHKKMRVVSVTASNDVIQSLAVDGNKLQRDGSVPYPGGDVVDALVYGNSRGNGMIVKNCEVKNGIEDGIGSWNGQYNVVDNCISHDNGTLQAGAQGIASSGPLNYGEKITNNTIYGNSNSGVWIAYGSSNVLVQNNNIYSNSRLGITISGLSLNPSTSKQVSMIGNNIHNNGAAGIYVVSSQNGTISANTLINNGTTGLTITDQGTISSSYWTVSNNTCSNTTSARTQKYGIKILGLTNNTTLTGNICQNNGTSINDQIYISSTSAVNSDWQTVNTISYISP